MHPGQMVTTGIPQRLNNGKASGIQLDRLVTLRL